MPRQTDFDNICVKDNGCSDIALMGELPEFQKLFPNFVRCRDHHTSVRCDCREGNGTFVLGCVAAASDLPSVFGLKLALRSMLSCFKYISPENQADKVYQ